LLVTSRPARPCLNKVTDMHTFDTEVQVPELFKPNQHLSDEINHNIIQSEIDGGVYLRDLRCGSVLRIETQDWICTLLYCEEGEALVWGHPVFCPDPIRIHVSGSTWGGSMLKESFIGRGMHLEMRHPRWGVILTSKVIEIESRNLSDVMGWPASEVLVNS